MRDTGARESIGAVALSAREREVLALVAAGLTNRGISQRLVISLGTADRHVHNILTKLGCANRTEAAAHARSNAGPTVPATMWSPPRQAHGPATRFVGRADERARLAAGLAEAKAGHGSLTMVVGEPGIGKTRLTEEAAREGNAQGFTVLWGRCYEGDWAPPYVPFAEALTALARSADLRELRSDLGFGGPPLARIVPVIRERLPELPEPTPLGPNEEQFRILDAVLQLLLATAKRRPLLFVIDDLHWADAGTLNMLRYGSRFLKESRICLVGNYRDVELDRQHPLGEALAELRRGAGYERLLLAGLEDAEVGEMAESIAEHELEDGLVEAIRIETGGNPLFIREMLLHLIEEGTMAESGQGWSAERGLAIPESVHEVIGRRLSRLSDDANRLLSAASAFNGPFRFDVTADAAELEERAALDAIDAASEAQLIHASGTADTYEFGHALIAHTLYTELNPSRQVRLHRRIAEALEGKADAPPAEVAYQYLRSSALPGAEAGVAWALRAADEAASSYAWAQVVTFCEMALELMAPDDERRSEVTGRIGLALPSIQKPDEAIAAMELWAGALFERGRTEEGLEYLFRGHRALSGMGFEAVALELARFAVPHFIGLDNRPTVWFRLLLLRDEHESAPGYLGIHPESAEKDELIGAWDALPIIDDSTLNKTWRLKKSRAAVRSVPRDYPLWALWNTFAAGELRETVPAFEARAAAALRAGLLDEACDQFLCQAGCYIARGEFSIAQDLVAQATRIASRLPFDDLKLEFRATKLAFARSLDVGWEDLNLEVDRAFADRMQGRSRWAAASATSSAARVKARLGLVDRAHEFIELAIPTVVGAPGGGIYTLMICNLAASLWELDKSWFADIIQANLHEKVIAGDFRWPTVDSRLAMAHLSAVQGRIDDASEWFAKARVVLEEQGARPLRATCDYDEALALVRHSRKTGALLDRERVLGLLAAGLAQFEEIGMTGWIERAKTLRAEIG